MKVSIRLPLAKLSSLFFRKYDSRYLSGDLAALKHDVVLSGSGTKFSKGSILRVVLQDRPSVWRVFAVRDVDQECFRVTRWSLRKLTKMEVEIHESYRETQRQMLARRRV